MSAYVKLEDSAAVVEVGGEFAGGWFAGGAGDAEGLGVEAG